MIHPKQVLSAVLVTAAVALAVPGTATAADYTIVSGDYLARIARAHGTTWQKLHQANPSIQDANKIYPGTKLYIPQTGEMVNPQAMPAAPPVAAPAPLQASLPTGPAAVTGCDLARSLINQYSWNHETAYNVMYAESTCNPNAANWNDNHGACKGSFGLFQINCTKGHLYDPAANVAAAYAMYQASGWQPWGFTTCKTKVVCN